MDKRIDMSRLPQHIAVIMDGNGRWAKQQGKARVEGHEAGAKSVRRIIVACRELGIPTLSLFAFSTENWRRSKTEVDALFRLLSKYIRKEIDELDSNNVRIRTMGRMEGLPRKAVHDLESCMQRTETNTALEVCVGINYGGRAEIVDAAKHIALESQQGNFNPSELDEVSFAQHLYVPDCSEVDLLIRTSGEQRISNFMLWQIAYAEILTPSVLWPDFDEQCLYDAILEYQQRDRRFGGS